MLKPKGFEMNNGYPSHKWMLFFPGLLLFLGGISTYGSYLYKYPIPTISGTVALIVGLSIYWIIARKRKQRMKARPDSAAPAD